MLTDEQHEKRSKGIGGSDVSVIFGLSSYKTPYVLFLEKAGLREPEFSDSELTMWGHLLEPVIRTHFESLHGLEVEQPDTLTHPKYDFILGNLDGWIPGYNAVHEIKCSDKFMGKLWGEPGSDVIPMQYLLQVAHYVGITNADKAIISVLIGGNEYREFEYVRDLELEQTIIKACCDFWDCVKEHRDPDLINIADLKIKYPESNGSDYFADEKTMKLLANITNAKSEIKRLKELEDDYKFQILYNMQACERIVDETGKPLATYKTNKSGRRTFLLK